MSNETIYDRHVIRSMKVGDTWQARAIRVGSRPGTVHSATVEKDAIALVKHEIDANRTAQRAARGADGYPTAVEVEAALGAIPINDGQSKMLTAHALKSDNIMTPTELAAAAGYGSLDMVNVQYGKLGHNLAAKLDWSPPVIDGEQVWTLALATGADGDTRSEITAKGLSEWRWKLRPEVAEAWLVGRTGGQLR